MALEADFRSILLALGGPPLASALMVERWSVRQDDSQTENPPPVGALQEHTESIEDGGDCW